MKEIVKALRCCAKGLGRDDACENCKVGEIQDWREYIEFAAANVIERLTAENAALRAELPGQKRHMPRQVLHLDALREHPEPHLRCQPPRQGQPAARSCSGKADSPCRQPDKEAQTHCEIASTTPASGRRGAPP